MNINVGRITLVTFVRSMQRAHLTFPHIRGKRSCRIYFYRHPRDRFDSPSRIAVRSRCLLSRMEQLSTVPDGERRLGRQLCSFIINVYSCPPTGPGTANFEVNKRYPRGRTPEYLTPIQDRPEFPSVWSGTKGEREAFALEVDNLGILDVPKPSNTQKPSAWSDS